MRRMKRLMPILLCCVMAVGMSGCAKEDDEIVVRYLNFKPEVADVWEEIAEKYTAETGVKVEIISSPSNGNEQTLKSEIAKRNAPTIFQINGPVGYETWKNYCVDLTNTDLYSWVADKDMVITGEDGGVYGIPYVVEGYGIIYNDAIMQKYFSLPGKATTYTSMDQVNNFQKLKEVAEDMQLHKDELGIQGVFASTSFMQGEEWRWQTHLLNLPIYYEYKDKDATNLDELSFSYSKNFQNIFDLYINNSTINKTEVGTKTVNDSMAEFATGKCAMVQNGNWAWSQISSTEGNVVKEEDCKYLPIYTGASGEENQGLCIGTECYLAINSLVSEETQQASIDFVEWVFGSEIGKDYVTNQFQFITVFSTFSEDEVPSNPLAKEVYRSINDIERYSVSWNFTTFPSQEFKDGVADRLYNYCIDKGTYSEVQSYIVKEWKAQKSGN